MVEAFHARTQAQLRLALLGDCGCRTALAGLEAAARSAGLTGAEIDAALAGRSFDARTAAALAFACAIKAGETAARAQARAHALRLGISEGELSAIAAETQRIMAGRAR